MTNLKKKQYSVYFTNRLFSTHIMSQVLPHTLVSSSELTLSSVIHENRTITIPIRASTNRSHVDHIMRNVIDTRAHESAGDFAFHN